MNAPVGYGRYLKMLSERMECRANHSLQAHNLTFSQARTLLFLMRMPSYAASLKELEGSLHSAQSTVVGLSQRLEKKGLVQSFPDPVDRRVKHLRLTDAGLTMAKNCRANILRDEEQLVSSLSEEERKQLLRFFDLMYQAIRK